MPGEILKLKVEVEYSSGERFRVYEFTQDCPEIRASRAGECPMHAVAGDELWTREDDLTPYMLKRAGQTIGHPEYWVVAPYLPVAQVKPSPRPSAAAGILDAIRLRFEGEDVCGWMLTKTTECYPWGVFERGTLFSQVAGEYYERRPGGDTVRSYVAKHFVRAHETAIHPERSAALSNISFDGHFRGRVFFAYEPIAGTNIDSGDLILLRRDLDGLTIRGRVTPLTRGDYEQIKAYLSGNPSDPPADISPFGAVDYYFHSLERYFGDRRRWGLRAKPWQPRAFVVKPMLPERTEPIEAASDAAAIFELLSQVGGRMPTTRRAAG